MVQVIAGGSDEFNALVYGQKHPGTIQFLETQLANISHNVTEAGRNFYANAQELFERFNGAEAIRLAQAAVRKVRSIFQPDTIRCLWDLGEIQNAPRVMQRWIMAEPTVREAFHQQRCDGYSETYVDMHPGMVGKDHYDWRRVNHGMVEDIVDEDGEAGWKTTFYLDEIYEGDRELTLSEKVDILSTWDIVAARMKAGQEDPTSAFGNQL